MPSDFPILLKGLVMSRSGLASIFCAGFLLGLGLVFQPAISRADGNPAGQTENSERPWPPVIPNAPQGTVTLESPEFLAIPPGVLAGASKFVVAKQPPTVDLAFHQNLGPNPAERRLWSSWGDICVAKDGRVYVGIGDHGKDAEGDARCFLYSWDPKTKTLSQIVDMNKVVPKRKGQPA